MAKFEGRKDDMAWGHYAYPVTRSQYNTLKGLENLFMGLPRVKGIGDVDLWQSGFYSQNPKDGSVIIGYKHRSVTVDRNGRVKSNQ